MLMKGGLGRILSWLKSRNALNIRILLRMCSESRLPRRSKFCACRKLHRSCVLKRCQWSALPDKLGKRLRFVPPETFSRNKTIIRGHFVPLNRFIWNKTISHGYFVPLNRFVRNKILLHKTGIIATKLEEVRIDQLLRFPKKQ